MIQKNDTVTVEGAEYIVTEVGAQGVFGVKTSTTDEAGTAGDRLFLGSAEELEAAQEVAVAYEVKVVSADIEGDWASNCVGKTFASRADAQAAIAADPTAAPDRHGNRCRVEIVEVAQ